MSTRTTRQRFAHKVYKVCSWMYHHAGLIAFVAGFVLLAALNRTNPSVIQFAAGVLLASGGIVIGSLRWSHPSYAPLRRKLHHIARTMLLVELVANRSRHPWH